MPLEQQRRCPHPLQSQNMKGSNDDMRQVVCRQCGKTFLNIWPRQVSADLLQRAVAACVDVLCEGRPASPPHPGPPPMRTAEASTQTRPESVLEEKMRQKRVETRWTHLVVMAAYQEHGP